MEKKCNNPLEKKTKKQNIFHLYTAPPLFTNRSTCDSFSKILIKNKHSYKTEQVTTQPLLTSYTEYNKYFKLCVA